MFSFPSVGKIYKAKPAEEFKIIRSNLLKYLRNLDLWKVGEKFQLVATWFDYLFKNGWPYLVVFTDTQQADYHIVASIAYRANGAVANLCLKQYADLLEEFYPSLNTILTQRCSAVNVNMNVSFIDAKPHLADENIVNIDFILGKSTWNVGKVLFLYKSPPEHIFIYSN